VVDETAEDRSASDRAVNWLGYRCLRAWRAQLQRSMWPLLVVVQRVLVKDTAQVPLAEDQHPIGDLGADRQYEAFGEAVRPRTARRDLHHLDTRVRQDRVERCRELPGPIPDEEPKPGDVVAEVHDEVACLLCSPGPVGMPGHTQHVQVAVADLECEQDVEPSQRGRAVDVEEVLYRAKTVVEPV